jgi:hypothetical protein
MPKAKWRAEKMSNTTNGGDTAATKKGAAVGEHQEKNERREGNGKAPSFKRETMTGRKKRGKERKNETNARHFPCLCVDVRVDVCVGLHVGLHFVVVVFPHG